jgi:hypothetical protein
MSVLGVVLGKGSADMSQNVTATLSLLRRITERRRVRRLLLELDHAAGCQRPRRRVFART